MKILSIFEGAFPGSGPMAKRLHLYCKGLKEQGHEVKVVIPIKTIHHGRRLLTETQHGDYEGVPYSYLNESQLRSKNFLKRRFDDFLGYVKLCTYLLRLKQKPEIILVVDIRNAFPVVLYAISRIIGSKLIYELNEHPLILVNKLQFAVDKLVTYRVYDGFFTISSPLTHLVEDFKRNKARVLTLPIISENRSESIPSTPTHLGRYILHTGGLSDRKDGIVGMIEAFGIAVSQYNLEAKFLFTGSFQDSGDYTKIKETIQKYHLQDKVISLGFLSQEALLYYQSNCSLVIINKDRNFQNTYCFPTKLGEYMSLARPAIITNVGPQTEYLVDGVNCYLVEPGDINMLATKIVEALNNPVKSLQLGLNARKVSEQHFDYRIQGQRISEFITSLTA